MFTVYGLNGRIFSGPLEGLRALGPVQAVARLRAVEPLANDGQVGPSVVLDDPLPELGAGLLGSAEPLPRDALAAYAQTQASPLPRQPVNLVEQLMTRELVTVPLAATLAQAWALLAKAGVGQAPVLNADGRLVGLLLRADLLPLPEQMPDPAAWAAWFERPVAQVMWTPLPSAMPYTPIREVAQALLELNLPGLPVLSPQGALLGFLSRSDILRALTREPPLDLWG
ncbi:CBS domain-containing protein [Roseateles sp. GG27B]